MKRFIASLFTIFALAVPQSLAQSPNLSGSITRLDLANYQLLSAKNAANGYVGLSASSLVNPIYLYPGFNAAADGTIWVKSGAALVPQANSTSTALGIYAAGVHIGELNASPLYYGIEIDSAGASKPLILKSHTSNHVIYVGNGDTLGGANGAYSAFQWSIGPTGTFSLAGGSFSAAINLNSQNITNVGTLSGSALSANFSTATINGTADLNLTAGTGGVLVPNTSIITASGRALNRVSANTIYGQVAVDNTWQGVQTFLVQPVFSVPIDISQISGLQVFLDAKVNIDGSSTMGGLLNMGSHRVTNVTNPSSAQDAATKNYVDGLTVTSTGGTLTALLVAAPLTKNMAGSVTTLGIPKADVATAGYLSAADWAAFNAKGTALTPTAPIQISGGIISMLPSSNVNNGYLSSSDWILFNAKAPAANPSFTGTVTMATPLGATMGGTGQSVYVVGDMLYAATTTTLGKLSDVAIGSVLLSGGVGVLPNYGKVTTAHTTGINGTVFTSTNSATLASATGPTSIIGSGTGTVTLPANFFAAGKSIRLRVSGIISKDTSTTPTLDMIVKLGATTVGSTGAVALLAATTTNNQWELEVVITCRSAGVTGTVMTNGRFQYDNTTHTGTRHGIANTSTATVDTTGTLVVDLTATWSAASALNTITEQLSTIETLN